MSAMCHMAWQIDLLRNFCHPILWLCAIVSFILNTWSRNDLSVADSNNVATREKRAGPGTRQVGCCCFRYMIIA